MTGTRVWINEEKQVIKTEKFGQFTIMISRWYNEYYIELQKDVEQDPMESDWNSISHDKKTIYTKWIENEGIALKSYETLSNFYRSLNENTQNTRLEIGETYVELFFNGVEYLIIIGSLNNIESQCTVYRTSDEQDALERFTTLAQAHYKILG